MLFIRFPVFKNLLLNFEAAYVTNSSFKQELKRHFFKESLLTEDQRRPHSTLFDYFTELTTVIHKINYAIILLQVCIILSTPILLPIKDRSTVGMDCVY